MKRAFVILLSCVMLLNLCGCTSMQNLVDSLIIDDATQFSMGKIDGDRYTSEFIGLSFTLPEGGYFLPEEHLADRMDISPEMLASARENPDEIMECDMIFDMMARTADNKDEIDIYIMNTALDGTLMYSPEGYVNMFADGLKDRFTEQGATCKEYDAEQIRICDMDFCSRRLDITEDGQTIEQYLLARRIEKYMVLIYIFGDSPLPIDSIINECFS